MTNRIPEMTANGLSKRAAFGIAAISWPVLTFLELVLTKRLFPGLFNRIVPGPMPENEHELKMWLALSPVLLALLLIPALLGWAYGIGKRRGGNTS